MIYHFPFCSFSREKKSCAVYTRTNDSSIFTGNCFPSFERVLSTSFIFCNILQIPRIQSEGKNGITVIIGIYDRDISYTVSSFFVGKSFPCKITFYGFSFFVFLYVHI